MIDISKLTEADKWRQVKYQEEVGLIAYWNDQFIFVQYWSPKIRQYDSRSKATRPEDLEFV